MADRTPDDARFDPRYSPMFQPGYDPTVHGTAPEESATHEGVALESRPAYAPTDAALPPEPTALWSRHPDASPADDSVDSMNALFEPDGTERPASDAGDTGETGGAPQPAQPSAWRNPYIIVLTIIGIVLTVSGLVGYRSALDTMITYFGATSVDGPPPAGERPDFVMLQFNWTLGPILAVLGILTLIGVIFFVAVRWLPQGWMRPESGADAEGDR